MLEFTCSVGVVAEEEVMHGVERSPCFAFAIGGCYRFEFLTVSFCSSTPVGLRKGVGLGEGCYHVELKSAMNLRMSQDSA